MGAFNHWARGTFLEKIENRQTVTVAMNLLFGAAVATRLNWLQHQGIALPRDAVKYRAMELPRILELLGEPA